MELNHKKKQKQKQKNKKKVKETKKNRAPLLFSSF